MRNGEATTDAYTQWLTEACEGGFDGTPLWNAQLDFRWMALGGGWPLNLREMIEEASRPKDCWSLKKGGAK